MYRSSATNNERTNKGVTDSWKNELDLAYFNAKINHIFYCRITLILGLEFKAFHLK